MVITKTPFRISFFGGGSDYKEFYSEYGGSVLSTTFDKYCYVNVRHLSGYFDYKTHLTYSKSEFVNRYEEIEHPVIREAMSLLDMHELRLIYDADLPARSGLGTSSSFAVGMLNAFHALKGKYVDSKTLAEEAIYLERILCNEAGGIQDQIAAAYGGFNRIQFRENGFEVYPVIISQERKKMLNQNLMLFFTGFTRFSSEIAIEQKRQTKNKKTELLEMVQLVDEAESVLTGNGSLREFGKLLDYTWRLKREITNYISNDSIDALYDMALKNGAVGGKLLGAGGGGFLLLYVEPESQKIVRQVLNKLLYIPFLFEDSGTKVLYYMPENYEGDLKCQS